MSISFVHATDKTSIAHNNRTELNSVLQRKENINIDRHGFNEYLVTKDIKEMYTELFDEALERYNAKQKGMIVKLKITMSMSATQTN